MKVIQFIGFLLTFIFFAIAILHIYWGLGGKWGLQSSLPTHPDPNIKPLNPGTIAFIIVILGLLSMGGLSAVKSGLIKISLPSVIDQYGLSAIAGVFLLRAIGEFN